MRGQQIRERLLLKETQAEVKCYCFEGLDAWLRKQLAYEKRMLLGAFPTALMWAWKRMSRPIEVEFGKNGKEGNQKVFL